MLRICLGLFSNNVNSFSDHEIPSKILLPTIIKTQWTGISFIHDRSPFIYVLHAEGHAICQRLWKEMKRAKKEDQVSSAKSARKHI